MINFRILYINEQNNFIHYILSILIRSLLHFQIISIIKLIYTFNLSFFYRYSLLILFTANYSYEKISIKTETLEELPLPII